MNGEEVGRRYCRCVRLVLRVGVVNDNLIRSWKLALESKGTDAFPGQGKLPAVEDELRRLRAENKRLLAERDILKKAAAFFAKEAL